MNGGVNNVVYARYHQQLDEFVERRKPVLEQQEQLAKRLASPSPVPINQRGTWRGAASIRQCGKFKAW